MTALPMPLSSLQPGEQSNVVNLDVKGSLRRRILDLGIVPGTVLFCIGKAPAGDPIAYLVRGAVIALRSEDAGLIFVKKT
ncbi:MAG TPA: FeoA family protein [Desulfitobacteriaceae bacterium]|nr:FeoA family protein [Desulfitobacteriaceae bacterium]